MYFCNYLCRQLRNETISLNDYYSLSSFLKYLFYFNVYESLACMYICASYLFQGRSEEGMGSPGTGGTDDCEPPCVCQGPELQEEQVILTSGLSL